MVLWRAVVWPFPRPSMCRPVPSACLRTAWRNVTTIVPATPCHQSNDGEPYRKYTDAARFGTLASGSVTKRVLLSTASKVHGSASCYGMDGKLCASGFTSWRTVPPLFPSCLAVIGALDRDAQQPFGSASYGAPRGIPGALGSAGACARAPRPGPCSDPPQGALSCRSS
jgi:hypothetical protein